MITRLSLNNSDLPPTARQQQQQRQTNKTSNLFDSFSPTATGQLDDSDSSASSSSSTSVELAESYSNLSSSSVMTRQKALGSDSEVGQLSSPKSPILIKYNYYDHNGARQEQPNQDMRHQRTPGEHRSSSPAAAAAATNNNKARVQRQLSPTFKQNLDQIVSSQLQQSRCVGINSSNRNGSMSTASSSSLMSSPSPISPGGGGGGGGAHTSSSGSPDQLSVHFARRYQLSSYEQRCLRCQKTVYQMDKVGPLKEFTFYHQNCFKCRECGTKLTLRTYFNNQQCSADLEVYCHRHCPKTGPGKLDNQSVGIRAALNAPKVFDGCSPLAGQMFVRDDAGNVVNCNSAPNYNSDSINNRLALLHLHHQSDIHSQQQQRQQQSPNGVDSRALYIQHAVQQTKLQSIYKQSQVDKKISRFLERRLEYLEPKQKSLEMRHRQEEDALFKAFEQKWRQEERSISEQIRDEWQLELNKLLDKYRRQLSSIGHSSQSTNHQHPDQFSAAGNELAENFNKAATDLPRQLLILQQQQQHNHRSAAAAATTTTTGEPNNNNGAGSKQQMIEYERLNLEKTMTIKLDRKKETLKRKLKEFERQATAELVEKQSREMLALISMKLDEYKEEQKRKIGSDLEHFEAIEKLANRLAGSSLNSPPSAGKLQDERNKRSSEVVKQQSGNGARSQQQSSQLLESPPPEAPKVSKMELYNYEEADEVFRDIDQLAMKVAKEDQQSFTDLVHHLTRNCLTDVEKVRAIFRWITVKNLNTMHFDSSVKADTPLGLLRGIKNGSESYHVLFKRLCSYAGLHCVVIKGYSKSAGYQPGIKFEGNRFRNSWNAVYVAGAWRFVQCNWGARHLVSVAIMQDKNQPSSTSSNNNNNNGNLDSSAGSSARHAAAKQPQPLTNAGRSHQHQQQPLYRSGANAMLPSPNHGRRGLVSSSASSTSSSSTASLAQISVAAAAAAAAALSPSMRHHHAHYNAIPQQQVAAGFRCSSAAVAPPHAELLSANINNNNSSSTAYQQANDVRHLPATAVAAPKTNNNPSSTAANNDGLRYEYDDHYFLTDPDEFIYEFFPLAPEWQLLKTRPIALSEFEQLPFVRSLFFKYGLYFPQHDIRSVLYTDSSGATTIKIGMPTHMIPSLIFHYNLKYYDSDLEHHDGVSLKRFVMQSVESGSDSASSSSSDGQLLSNVVSFRVHLPENGAYILDIFANSTTPNQYITGEPMKFKSVCKFKIVAKSLKTVMIPLPDCASGEYGPMKATRLFGIIPITHESALISVQNDKRFLEVQFRMTRPLVDFMASLHKNNYDEKQLSKSIKIFVDGDIVFVTVKFFEDGQYGLDIYTRDRSVSAGTASGSSFTTSGAKISKASSKTSASQEPKKQLLTHCCKYLINVRTPIR